VPNLDPRTRCAPGDDGAYATTHAQAQTHVTKIGHALLSRATRDRQLRPRAARNVTTLQPGTTARKRAGNAVHQEEGGP
jgi:hypothetical protein